MTLLRTNDTAFANAAPVSANTTRTMIVVPCYNEADRLDGGAFLKALAGSPDMSFVFVNDGSTDATLHCLEALQLANPRQIDVISLHRNSGKAQAVRNGLQHACRVGADRVGYWDADLATPLEAIADFKTVLDRYFDITVVYGARRQLLGHRINRSVSRRAVSRICANLARLAVGLPIGDTQCGAKLFRNTPTLRRAIDTPFTAGWLFDVELFSRIAATTQEPKMSFYEVPLSEWHEVAGSKVSNRAILRSGVQMVRLIARRFLARTEPAKLERRSGPVAPKAI